jgi:hypothetical protein
MARLTKQDKCDRLSLAYANLADCGRLDLLKGDWRMYAATESEFFRWAARQWIAWWKSGTNSRRYKRQHRAYMDSPEWAVKRAMRFGMDGHKCQDCSGAAQCVHHISYERWKCEDVAGDLISLCHACHYHRHFPEEKVNKYGKS